MLLQAKNGSAAIGGIAANSFEYANAVVQASIDEGNYACGEVSQLVVNPDESWSGSHGALSLNDVRKSTVRNEWEQATADQGFFYAVSEYAVPPPDQA